MKFLILFAVIAAASADFLTADQAGVLQSAWSNIKNSEVDILYAVFKAYPDIQAKFPKFVGKDLDSIKGSADFALHATRIVSFITEVVNLSGSEANVPAIQTLVSELGNNHKSRGVSKAQFNEFRTAITEYASTHTSWGDNVAAVWNQALDNVYAIIFAKLG
uniref:Globin n=1 Tax=Polypedilum nubifer TaxID=54969 RepID=V5YND8_9DIPT|nr:globin [Polypedilum nubifer]